MAASPKLLPSPMGAFRIALVAFALLVVLAILRRAAGLDPVEQLAGLVPARSPNGGA